MPPVRTQRPGIGRIPSPDPPDFSVPSCTVLTTKGTLMCLQIIGPKKNHPTGLMEIMQKCKINAVQQTVLDLDLVTL